MKGNYIAPLIRVVYGEGELALPLLDDLQQEES